MINLRSTHEIELLREAGRIVAKTHEYLAPFVKPGITTKQLDKLAEDFIISCGAKPSFKGLYGFKTGRIRNLGADSEAARRNVQSDRRGKCLSSDVHSGESSSERKRSRGRICAGGSLGDTRRTESASGENVCPSYK